MLIGAVGSKLYDTNMTLQQLLKTDAFMQYGDAESSI